MEEVKEFIQNYFDKEIYFWSERNKLCWKYKDYDHIEFQLQENDNREDFYFVIKGFTLEPEENAEAQMEFKLDNTTQLATILRTFYSLDVH